MHDSPPPAALGAFPVVISCPVQWGDQDAFGHVNNTAYFRWFESGRIAYFERLGLGHALPDTGLGHDQEQTGSEGDAWTGKPYIRFSATMIDDTA
jgi:hypothetical protein